ncbi:unnamed protein product [Eruca vesicaria subsp. sativa]|uniref:RRM domain-containing protein n=1 Tax=Eruca vesicaria subsp. sativa TaxID=29727 RepID=A0ABC8KXA5_ERUVS|nr:unnamed protein product [Eruca vesicaria subsp. sativa]
MELLSVTRSSLQDWKKNAKHMLWSTKRWRGYGLINSFFFGRWSNKASGSKAEREDSIRRTIYVSDIDQSVTEEGLAGLFSNCGQVVDCRICGDPHSVLRFAFVEFTEGARETSLSLHVVTRLRLLGDQLHSTRIAFVEFALADIALRALSCSGMVVGSQPISFHYLIFSFKTRVFGHTSVSGCTETALA